MSFVQEFGLGNGGPTIELTFPSNVAVGHSLMIAVSGTGATTSLGPSDIMSDTRGNQYISAGLAVHGTAGLSLWHCTVEHAISAGDKLDFAPDNALNRLAVAVVHITESIQSLNGRKQNSAPVSSLTVSNGDVDVIDSAGILFGGWNLESSARIFTPTSGWTAFTKQISTNGSNERAVIGCFKYSTADETPGGTLNTAAVAGGVSAAFGFDTPPPSLGLGQVIVGGSKKTVTALSVIIGGAKKPVTGAHVIIGGAKKAIP